MVVGVIPGIFFRFNLFSDGGGGSEHALFHLYVLSEGNIFEIEEIECNGSLYQDYITFVSGHSSVDAVQSLLQKFSKRYNGFKVIDNFQLLDTHVTYLCGKVGRSDDVFPLCVTQSNEFFQIVYRFQQFVSLRVGFIEGAHRHLVYIR